MTMVNTAQPAGSVSYQTARPGRGNRTPASQWHVGPLTGQRTYAAWANVERLTWRQDPRIKRQAQPCCKSSKLVRSFGLACPFGLRSVRRSPMPCDGVAARVAAYPGRPLRPGLAALLGP